MEHSQHISGEKPNRKYRTNFENGEKDMQQNRYICRDTVQNVI